jgi:hypothetical protein
MIRREIVPSFLPAPHSDRIKSIESFPPVE